MKNIIETAQEYRDSMEYDTAFNLADIAKNVSITSHARQKKEVRSNDDKRQN